MGRQISLLQNSTIKLLFRKPTVILPDGNTVLSIQFSNDCTDSPEVFSVLAVVCSGRLTFDLIHTCQPTEEAAFSLDTGQYSVEIKQGLTLIETFKARLLPQ